MNAGAVRMCTSYMRVPAGSIGKRGSTRFESIVLNDRAQPACSVGDVLG